MNERNHLHFRNHNNFIVSAVGFVIFFFCASLCFDIDQKFYLENYIKKK